MHSFEKMYGMEKFYACADNLFPPLPLEICDKDW